MHWSLNVTFGDNRNKPWEGITAQNLEIVQRLVFNTLKDENKVQPKMSKPSKRVLASANPVQTATVGIFRVVTLIVLKS